MRSGSNWTTWSPRGGWASSTWPKVPPTRGFANSNTTYWRGNGAYTALPGGPQGIRSENPSLSRLLRSRPRGTFLGHRVAGIPLPWPYPSRLLGSPLPGVQACASRSPENRRGSACRENRPREWPIMKVSGHMRGAVSRGQEHQLLSTQPVVVPPPGQALSSPTI